ncbi:MAG TPA: hypothetical protein VHH73_00605 [Verrucomicrobiae bacterium]|nr:hypothetical protein [Verrucomicrobiae bacterium]
MKFLQSLKQALVLLGRTDMFDTNYLFASKRFNVSIYPSSFYCGRQGVVRRLLAYARHCLTHTVKLFTGRRKPLPPGQVLFYASSLNQVKSVYPLLQRMNGIHGIGHFIGDAERIPVALSYYLGVLFSPFVFARYLRANSYQKDSFGYCIDTYLLFPGYFVAAYCWLKLKKPRALVLTNDHSMRPRALRLIANAQGVPVFYLQHATVMERFPALEFDYAFLDGRAALLAYDEAGPSKTRVFLIGISMADKYVEKVNPRPTVVTVGVCVGSMEPVERVRELCGAMVKRFPGMKIVLRPHPAEAHGRLMAWRKLVSDFGFEMSNASEEVSFDYLLRCDVVIASDSGILLESALVNTTPLYYDFPELKLDFYGFQRFGLARYHSRVESICDEIGDLVRFRPDCRHLAGPYCASLGTRYHGRSSEVASMILAQFVETGQVNLRGWKKVTGLKNLEAYEFDETIDLLAAPLSTSV